MKEQRRFGFTLIELLVVVAIIAILAAILFPIFARAKRNADYTSCRSNTQQWLKAMQMYMGDWNDFFPWCRSTKYDLGFAPKTHHDLSVPLFYELMWKYTAKNEGIKWCTASVLANGTGGGWSYWFQCKYAWDRFTLFNEKANLCGIHISEVKFPTRSPAIGDVNRCHECKDCGEKSGQKAYLYPIGYVDGHVRDVVMIEKDESKYWYFGRDGSPTNR